MTSEYLQQNVGREGIFRGWPVAWTLEESKGTIKDANGNDTGVASQSAAIRIQFSIIQEWVTGSDQVQRWSDQWGAGYFVESKTWIIGRDGRLLDGAISNLRECGIWNGDFDQLNAAPPQTVVHLDVQPNEWNGKTYYRAEWINVNADEPRKGGGQMAPVDQGVLERMKAQHGAALRAMSGAGTPPGAPPAPPAPGAPQAAPAAPVAAPPAVAPPASPPTPMPPTAAPAPPVAAPPATPMPPTAGGQPSPPAPPASPGVNPEDAPF